MTRYSASLFIGKELHKQASELLNLGEMLDWVNTTPGTYRLDLAKIVDGEETAWASLVVASKDGTTSIYKYSGLTWHEVFIDEIADLLE